MFLAALIKKNLLNLAFISFFLIRIPSFTIPLLPIGIYSHHVFRIINFIIIYVVLFHKKIRPDKKQLNIFLVISLFYFLFQAISVLGAVNLRVFLVNFEKTFTIFLFFLAVFPIFKQNHKTAVNRIIEIIIITTAINELIQILMIISPGLFIRIGRQIIHPGIVDIVRTNLERGRIYFEFYSEISIPILFYAYFSPTKSRFSKNFYLLIILSVMFISFFSNIRTRFLVALFSLITSFFLYRKSFSKNFIKTISIFIAVALTIFVGYRIVMSNVGFSVVDRFFLQDKVEDADTISFRFDMLKYSFEMGNSRPLTGVGLGNFYEYIPTKLKNMSFKNDINVSALLYPHNIFAQTYAETGIPGLISLMVLTIYMLVKDFKLFKQPNLFKKSVSLSFWSLFIFALFNPATPLTFFANFFVLRMLIEI